MPEHVSRQPAVYTARPAAIAALAASPWSPLVAIGGQRQIVLYNTDSSELAGILPFPEGIPYSLRFSRSGKLLLAGGGHSAVKGLAAAYDVQSGKRLAQVGDELDAVLAADINPSQTLIALGGPQKLVRIFNVADGASVVEIRKHTDWITAVEFSPDGVLLATADRAGGVLVWEAGTDREFQALEGHKAAVTAMSWRDDSNVLATAGEDGIITLWGIEKGKRIKNIQAHPGGVTSVAVPPRRAARFRRPRPPRQALGRLRQPGPPVRADGRIGDEGCRHRRRQADHRRRLVGRGPADYRRRRKTRLASCREPAAAGRTIEGNAGPRDHRACRGRAGPP